MSGIAALSEAGKYLERSERDIRNKWQDLPDELILKILSYLEVIDLISCGQVSKRTRNISQDSSLWVTANLEKKIVKTDLLELILSKGCKILNISNSIVVGSLSSNIKSHLKVLNLSQSAWGLPTLSLPGPANYYEEYMAILEQLLLSCCSLQQLEMEGLCITSKMAASICKNGKTLQALNLNDSFVYESFYPYYVATYRQCNPVISNILQTIIKYCRELKEVDLSYVNGDEGLSDVDLDVLAKIITPNVEKLNLRNHEIKDAHVKILLSRCNKIKTLTLAAYLISDDSLTYIKQYLNLTLEELSLIDCGTGYENNNHISFAGFLELKSIPRLKVLNLYHRKYDCEEIQNLRQLLPHIKISHTTSNSRVAEWALAHPEFEISVNPITTRGADYAYSITACPPGYENLAEFLHTNCKC